MEEEGMGYTTKAGNLLPTRVDNIVRYDSVCHEVVKAEVSGFS